MLETSKLETLKRLLDSVSQEELVWINGFLSGIAHTQSIPIEIQESNQINNTIGGITIAYGTETGNAKSLATKLVTLAKGNITNVKLVNLEQYRFTDIAREKNFFIVISTQGEGEPPTAAKRFYEYVHSPNFSVPNLKFGVIALGDSAYPLFCKTGDDVDLKLKEAGGTRIASIIKCDVAYEQAATEWFENALAALRSVNSPTLPPLKKEQSKNIRRIYNGNIVGHVNLNDTDSNKETYHIEIVTEGVEYTPGDSIGIIPNNPIELVDSIINITGVDRGKIIDYKGNDATIFSLLHEKLNITYLLPSVVKKYGVITQQIIPETKIGLFDLLNIYPVNSPAQFENIITELNTISPRLYSISSSPSAHSDEVHITVSKDKFLINGELNFGLCSNYLSNQNINYNVNFFVHKNNNFRLPDNDKDIIMIGPGTGIAPFRSFLYERNAIGANGRNWLFFGDQHFVTDFLYQTEIQQWAETGLLTNVSLAFSRDQKEKIYIQDRIIDNGAEFYKWLEEGAYIYICGSKYPMSFDVENAILEVIKIHGCRSESESVEYLEILKSNDRFFKDVY